MLTLGNVKEIKEIAADSNSSLAVLLALDGVVLADIVATRATQVSLFSSQFFLLPAEMKYQVTALTVGALLVSTIALPIVRLAFCWARTLVEPWLNFVLRHDRDSAMTRHRSAGRNRVRKGELLSVAIDKGNGIALQLHDRHERDCERKEKTITSFFSLLLLLVASYQLGDAGHVTAVYTLWGLLGPGLKLLASLVMTWLFWVSIDVGEGNDDLVYLPESTLVPTMDAKEEATAAAVKALTRVRPGDV
ncbi:hypothetical protein KH5H1_51150 [Corallococcus caeni]|uniref:hypothetical protein n=1 Tax=Corallococcus caeni TaxID=3082388 RepID=UPI002956A594|nr:hypothetical protein KH5H1_51150 [Corallococcus sp. KH5-1]